MKSVAYSNIQLGGYWQQRFELNKRVTIPAIYHRFTDTGRFEALKCNWVEGMPNKPHIFFDSDIAKWLEAAAYTIKLSPDKELEKIVDDTVDELAAHQWADGYINSYYTAIEPENRFTNRDKHELYCAGHLAEAAVAYYQATGKDKFLKMIEKYMDYIEQRFIVENSAAFNTPGHEEIELALIKLYDCTGNEKYLKMCEYFLETRGRGEKEKEYIHDYDQSDRPVRELTDACGHSVRATYLFCAMADLALKTDDRDLFEVCDRLFLSIAQKRMYITGGIGASGFGERFVKDYFLPNDVAYSETCASIGLAFFARRMSLIKPDAKYDDIAERAIYNCALAGVSLDGRRFFYVNPLEINIDRFQTFKKYYNSKEDLLTQRVEVFKCSCCPPNIARMIASVGDFLYTYDDDTVYVHHFMESEARWDGITIRQETEYPYEGKIRFTVSGMTGRTLAVRIPGWTKSVLLNGQKIEVAVENGFARIPITGTPQSFDIEFDMKPRFVSANPQVEFDLGRVCLCRGPLVYCAESVLNGGVKLNSIVLDASSTVELTRNDQFGFYEARVNAFEAVPSDELYTDYGSVSYAERKIRLLPYYAFANNGESDMLVWLRVK